MGLFEISDVSGGYKTTTKNGRKPARESIGVIHATRARRQRRRRLPLTPAASTTDAAAVADLHGISGTRDDEIFDVVASVDHLSLHR